MDGIENVGHVREKMRRYQVTSALGAVDQDLTPFLDPVFIAYSRAQASWADVLGEALGQRFGPDAVRWDRPSRAVEAARPVADGIGDASVVLVVIGRDGLAGLRTDELAEALSRPEVAVIPALVDDANLPEAHEVPEDLADLLRRQAFAVPATPGPGELDRLLDAVEQRRLRSARLRQQNFGQTAAAKLQKLRHDTAMESIAKIR